MLVTNHTMLVHRWKKLFAHWCRHPKTFMTRGKKCVCRVSIVVEFFFCLSWHVMTTMWDEVVRKTKSTWVGLTIIPIAKVQMSSTDNMMSTCWWQKGQRTWVYSCETWDLVFLQWRQNIWNHIMGCNMFLTMGTKKKVGPYMIQR
jgi:hypothetical protein